MSQADIDKRQTKDAAMYLKRTQGALSIVHSGRRYLSLDDPYWAREAARLRDNLWYRRALEGQRAAYDQIGVAA